MAYFDPDSQDQDLHDNDEPPFLDHHDFDDDDDDEPPTFLLHSIYSGSRADSSNSEDDESDVYEHQPVLPVPQNFQRQFVNPVLNHRLSKLNVNHERGVCTYDMTEEEAPLFQVYIFFK